MFKIKLKPKQLKEITDQELEDVKDILSGDQLGAMFEGDQRFEIDLPGYKDINKVVDDIVDSTKESMYGDFFDYIYNFISNLSTGKYTYNIGFDDGKINTGYNHVIPKGPLTGQSKYITKKFNLTEFFELYEAVRVLMHKHERLISARRYVGSNLEAATAEYDEALAKVQTLSGAFLNMFPEVHFKKEDPDDDVSKLENWFGSRKYPVTKSKSSADYFAFDIAGKSEDTIQNRNIYITVMSSLADKLSDIYIDKAKVAEVGRAGSKAAFQTFVNSLQSSFEDRKIIFSRAPIDLARMSDFKQSGIESCHSPPSSRGGIGGSEFKCALFDAKRNGAVAFLVTNEDFEKYKDKLQEREFFGDKARNIVGPIPLARLRIRRFYSIAGNVEIGIPEFRIYGATKTESFKEKVYEICKESQIDAYRQARYFAQQYDVSNFIFVGGEYSDDDPIELVNTFLKVKLRLSRSEPELFKATQYNIGDLHTLTGREMFLKAMARMYYRDATKLDDRVKNSLFGVRNPTDKVVTGMVATLVTILSDPEIIKNFLALPVDHKAVATNLLTEWNFGMIEVAYSYIDHSGIHAYIKTPVQLPNPLTYTRDVIAEFKEHFDMVEFMSEDAGPGIHDPEGEIKEAFEDIINKHKTTSAQQSAQLEAFKRKRKMLRSMI